MAIATSTALAAASIASSAVGAGMSFTQANKQNKLRKQAEADAEAAMLEARQKLDVNFAEQMEIKKEAYDLERQAMLSAGAQATEAGMMSERGAAATAGRVFAGQQQAQGQIRSAMADEMTNIESAILEEEGRLRDLKVGLDLQEVVGQQQMAADAQAAATAARQQGIQGIVNAAEKGVQYIPLYPTQKVDTPKTTTPKTTTQTFNPLNQGINQGQFGIQSPSVNVNVPQVGIPGLPSINPFNIYGNVAGQPSGAVGAGIYGLGASGVRATPGAVGAGIYDPNNPMMNYIKF